jgi:hypothetical protein
MDDAVRNLVRQRAGNRCEYCRLPQLAVDATFHVDHIVALQHVDEVADDPESLALACDRCNLCKGTNLASIDPQTKDVVLLFNPRLDNWIEHFAMHGAEIVGLSATGRATARLLQMNARHRVELRQWLIEDEVFD